MVSNFFRKSFQSQGLNTVFFPGSLISKRMFFNHVGFFDLLSKNNSNYFWYSGSYYNLMVKNKFFFKTPLLFNNSGNSILINSKFTAEPKDLEQIFLINKNILGVDLNTFNFDFLFNFFVCLDLIKSYYSALVYLHIYHFFKK
jgi:hypothetical protein